MDYEGSAPAVCARVPTCRRTIYDTIMNWIYQVLSFFVAFGPVILCTLLWHLIWSNDSGSSGGSSGGPHWEPQPPPPSFSGDRSPVRDVPTPSPVLPQRERT